MQIVARHLTDYALCGICTWMHDYITTMAIVVCSGCVKISVLFFINRIFYLRDRILVNVLNFLVVDDWFLDYLLPRNRWHKREYKDGDP